ncbi:MAG: FtsX-like permease family protein, partial [Clostridium sp.]
MLNNYKQLTIKYMKKDKGNAIAIFISLVLTISLITSIVVILDNNMKNEYARLKREQGEYDVRLQNIDQDKLGKIESSDSAKDYSIGRSEGIINLQKGNGAYSLVEVYDLNKKAYDETFGFKVNYGRMPENSDEVLIHGGIINKLGQYYKIGDTIKVDVETNRNIEMYNYYTIYARSINKPVGTQDLNYTGDVMDDLFPKLIKETKEYKVVGIVDVGENNVLWENRILGLLTDEEEKVSDGLEVYTTLTEGKHEEALANEVGIRYIGRTLSSTMFGVEASDVKYPGYIKAKYEGVLSNGNNRALLGFVSIFILAAIYNAFHISIAKKIRNYGILRAIGATMGQISYLIIKEAIIIFAIAIPFGFLVGIYGLKLEVYVLNKMFNINNVMNTNLDMGMVLAILQVVAITVIYAIAISIRKEGKLTPVDAMSGAMNIKRAKKIEAKNFLGQSIEDVDNDDGELEIKKILDFDETTFKYKVMKKLFKFEGAFAHKNITRNPSRNRLCIITLTSTMIMIILFLVQTINGNIASGFARSSDMWDISYISEVNPVNSNDIKDIESIEGVNGVYRNIESIVPIVVDKN